MTSTNLLAPVTAILLLLSPLMGQHPDPQITPTVRHANSAKLLKDLASLVAESDDIVIVHINRATAKPSPSRDGPITVYEATEIRGIKGGLPRIRFIVPVGTALSDNLAPVSVAYEGFTPLAEGKRYVVFLQMSRTTEPDRVMHFRLTGDAIQGAFELNDELIEPAFRADALWRLYWHMSVLEFLDKVEALVISQRSSKGAR
jgi:hypothetical protein